MLPTTRHRPHLRRRALLAAIVTVTVCAGAPTVATARTELAVSGSTLAITGSSDADLPSLQFQAPESPASPGYTVVYDEGGIADPLPPGCSRDAAGAVPAPTVAFCADGGTAPRLTRLELHLGDGDDEPDLEACFDAVAVDAGEGDNGIVVPDCAEGTLTWTSGAGEDDVATESGSAVAIDATLGDGDDTLRADRGAAVAHGGPGDDELTGSRAADRLFGDDGNDRLAGRDGDDVLSGDAGDDTLGLTRTYDDDPGADDYFGGGGRDTLDYDDHEAGVSVSLDATANDGAGGERDNVHGDIEVVRGTYFADVMTGGPGDDRFDGGDGDDRLDGRGGRDSLDGEEGDDAVLARDGAVDDVACGAGDDTAQVDAGDRLATGVDACEAVDRAAGPLLRAPGSGQPSSRLVKVTVRGRPTIARGARVTVTCVARCRLTISLRISATTARRHGLGRAGRVVARRSAVLAAAGSRTYRVVAPAGTRRRLRTTRSVPALLRVQARRTARGRPDTRTLPLRLLRR